MSFGSTATANGSAGASLATSSFANQGLTNTASAFMQAFGGVDQELAVPINSINLDPLN